MTYTMSVSSKLHAALSKPVTQRCYDLDRLIEETNMKELHLVFQPLIEHIFGFNNQPSWYLLQTSKSRLFQDYNSMFAFLSPRGALFKLIYKLLEDEYLRYEFSMSCVPAPTRSKLEEGLVPGFYRNKLQLSYRGQVPGSVWLNAFEFFFCHFAFYITNHAACKVSTMDSASENLYFSLLEAYLDHFLPFRAEVHAMAHEPVPVRGPILHHSHSLSALRSTAFRPSHQEQTSPSRYSLFRQSYSTFQPNPSQGSPGGAVMGPLHRHGVDEYRQTDNWRTEAIVQILVEFWLNQNTISETQTFNSSPSNQYMSSVDHVRCVRMLVKHLHYFTNSLQPSMYHSVTTTSLDELKSSIWPCYVQKRLYVFLKYGFQKWPLDSSFRMLLETWLSYIQPWRYLDPNQVDKDDKTDDERHGFGPKWRGFVQDNILFYSQLLQDFFTRICRTDLSTSKNAFMLYRVAKIYGADNLAGVVKEVEAELIEPMPKPSPRSHSDLGSSYLTPPSSHAQDLTTPTILVTLPSTDMESSTFTYRPLLCDRTKHQVEQLFCIIAQSKSNSHGESDPVDSNSSNTILSWLGLNQIHDYNSLYRQSDDPADGRKTSVHLEHAAELLKRIFDIDDATVAALTRSHHQRRTTNENVNQNNKLSPPEHVLTEEGPRLTPLGRYQVMNGLRKFPILYKGDPELRPINNYENATLVRWLYDLASWINLRFGDQFNEVYTQENFKARVVQQLLLPPFSPPTSPTKLSPRQPQTDIQRKLAENPRLSLRFLANYRNLLYVALAYVALNVWYGIGPVGFCIIVSYGVLLWAAFKAQFCK